ncbi:MAG: maleylpyruvate isomerase N-terminal domain-containing protein [Actinomycetota bacterium]
MIDRSRHLDLLDDHRRLLADVATGHLDRPVTTCGDWDVAQLCAHTAGVFAFVEATRAAGSVDAPVRVPPPEPDAAVIDALRETGDELSAGLRGADPTDPVWSWTDERTAGFWMRRIAYEATIHRYDGELAVGAAPTTIDADLAADGIDEWLTTYLLVAGRHPDPVIDGEASVHLHCTDTDGEWMVRWADGSPTLTREHGKGDVAARGPAWSLLLACYGRLDPATSDDVDVFGDAALLATATGQS